MPSVLTDRFGRIANAALAMGLFIIAYAVYESVHHRMSGAKLLLFWIGFTGIAACLLYRVLSQVRFRRRGVHFHRYGLRYRATCLVLLLASLAGGMLFSYLTWVEWQKPALYWELIGQASPSPSQYHLLWDLGNKSEDQSVRLDEIRLIELANVSLKNDGKAISLTCQVNAMDLPSSVDDAEYSQKFALPENFLIPPLDKCQVRLDFDYRHRFAIYKLGAVYHHVRSGNGWGPQDTAPHMFTAQQYVLVESARARLIDFSGLVDLAHRPSAQTREALILAIGRSHHPEALSALTEIAEWHDPRVRSVTSRALGELGDPQALPVLFRLVDESGTPQALRAIGTIGSPAGHDYLSHVLADSRREPYLRITAANVVGTQRIKTATPALISILEKEREDPSLQREALQALIRIDGSLATAIVLKMARTEPTGAALRALIEIMAELDREEILPYYASWLSAWRRYDLDTDDLQFMIDYIVAGSHRGMVGVLVSALAQEHNAEVQAIFVEALSQLAGKQFGAIAYPIYKPEILAANSKVIAYWNNWWGKARLEPFYADQVSPFDLADKM